MKAESDLKIIDLDNSGSADIDQLLELISLFVHDLESPLVVMQTVLRLMNEKRLDLSNRYHSELIKSSLIATERARSIIGDLMTISKSHKMGIPVRLTTIPLRAHLSQSVDLIRPAAFENNIAVELKGPQDDCRVLADPNLLLRIMDNLLFNALRHSPPDSMITVSAEKKDDIALVKINDQGPGLADFDPADLFDKYKQLRLRMDGKHRGVGLGLYFCHQAISAMNGEIRAQNGPDGGAEFIFTLKIKG
jgi:signal transduction histidine kinase